MDLSKFSVADLRALKGGDLSKISDQGLLLLKSQAATEPAYDPSAGGGTLQFGPFDTGIKTPQGLDRFLSGAGGAMTNIGRGIGQTFGASSRDDVAESRALDEPLMRTGAGMAGNITGNVVSLAPAAFIPGVNTIAGGAALGAGMGFLQPSVSSGDTLRNTGFGAVAGAAVPALTRSYQVAKAAAEPLYEAGQKAIVGRALRGAAGADANAVTQKLAQAKELLAGSFPTVGQAAENAGVASLERAATATNPAVTNAVSDTMKAQNAARVAALHDLAGADGRREFFAAARDATADQLYGAARRLGIDPAGVTPEALQNIAVFSKRIPDSVLNKAKELAQIGGEPMTDATSIQGLHWVKMGVDDLIGQAKRQGNDTMARQLVGLQKDLLTGMDRLSPAYADARQTYAAMSKPINQMDVAQSIADKSINKLSGNLQPNAYANALTNATAARATGNTASTLENTMEPEQLNVLNSILQDVKRSTAAQNAGRGVGSDTVQKLSYTNLLDQAGIPTFIRDLKPLQVAGNLASRGADAVYARANRELGNRLAEIMLDPKAAAVLMKQAAPEEQNAILKLLQSSASGAVLAANASKQ